jgi:hypothetical protein
MDGTITVRLSLRAVRSSIWREDVTGVKSSGGAMALAAEEADPARGSGRF